MSSNESPRRSRWRRTVALLALAAVLGLGWQLRGCLGLGAGLGGLWPGTGEPDTQAGAPAGGSTDDTTGDSIDARATPPPPCELRLDSGGLVLDGQPASIEEAVHACREAGKARLRATGGARAGTYDELVRALDRAGIPIEPR